MRKTLCISILIFVLFVNFAFGQQIAQIQQRYELLNWVNVRESPHGARGNGTTDDSVAFISACAAAINKILYIPPGTYKLSNNVIAGATVEVWFSNGVTLSVDNTKTFTISGKLLSPYVPTNTGLGTFTYSAATMPATTVAGIFPNTGLKIFDTGSDHALTIKPNENLTANKTLSIVTGDTDRSITFSGNPTLADWFDQAVKQLSSPKFADIELSNNIHGTPTYSSLGDYINLLTSSGKVFGGQMVVSGEIASIDAVPTVAGTGYTVADVLTVITGSGDATVTVSSIGGGEATGPVTGLTLTTGGTNAYKVGAGQATSGGTGTGCTIDVLTLINNGIAIDAGKGFIKTSDNELGVTKFFDWDAVPTLALTDEALNYVYVSYNTGTDTIDVLTTVTKTDINSNNQFPLGRVYQHGTIFHILNDGMQVQNRFRNSYERLSDRGFLEWMSGMALGEKATRYITIGEGVIYAADNKVEPIAYDSSATNFTHYYYKLNGAWVEFAATGQINNTQYNLMAPVGSESLASLGVPNYGVHWVYENFAGKVFVLLGQDNYNLSNAQLAQPPASVPYEISKTCILIGKVIIGSDDATFTSIQSAFTYTFTPKIVSDHNDLSNLAYADAGHTGFEPTISVLDMARGGSNKALTASANSLIYSDSDSFELLATGNSGVLVTSGAGVPSIATDIPTAVTIGTKYVYRAEGADVPVVDGGTGASDAGTARTNLGLGTIAVLNSPLPTANGGTGFSDSYLFVGLYNRERADKWAIKSYTTAAQRYILQTPNVLAVYLNGKVYVTSTKTDYDLSLEATWDAVAPTDYRVAATRAGKDFYVYACEQAGNTLKILISANASAPSGYDTTTSRLIGGFHCLCLSVGTIAGHTLTNFVTGDILPNSVWDHNFRPLSSPAGMVYSPLTHLWVDIYLASGTGVNTASVFNGTISDNRDWNSFVDDGGAVGKRLLYDPEFQLIATGSNEETNITGSADPVTTGAHIDTASRRMIANNGCEDMCGVMWQWLLDQSYQYDGGAHTHNNIIKFRDPATGAVVNKLNGETSLNAVTGSGADEVITSTSVAPAPAFVYYDLPGVKGSLYRQGTYGDVKLLAGAYWASGAWSGSRARAADRYRWTTSTGIGGRFASEPLNR